MVECARHWIKLKAIQHQGFTPSCARPLWSISGQCPWQGLRFADSVKAQKIAMIDNKALVNQSHPHAELIAAFKRAEADAAHKFGLIKAVANKGPKAIQAAAETATKAAKRRDSYAKKLAHLGVDLKD